MQLKTGESDSEVNYSLLKKAIKQRISYLKSKPSISEREVYFLFKDFFKELLNINYEFTHEELISEIEKTYLDYDLHEKIIKFIKKIGKIEYSNNSYASQELINLLNELDKLIDILLSSEHKHKIKTHLIFDKKIYEKFEKSNDSYIKEKFERIQYYLTIKDVENAKKIYKELLEEYNKLEEKNKKQYYEFIQEIYKTIIKFSLN
ncbi:MAG: hypothetical protein AB7V77_02365 [Candidatus Woesearchaeota archaeon]